MKERIDEIISRLRGDLMLDTGIDDYDLDIVGEKVKEILENYVDGKG